MRSSQHSTLEEERRRCLPQSWHLVRERRGRCGQWSRELGCGVESEGVESEVRREGGIVMVKVLTIELTHGEGGCGGRGEGQ